MLYLLYALFFTSCVVLIGSVLLQPGKTDAGALFTSNVSSTAFSPRGTASVLAKFTIVAAIVFMISALMISMPALSGNVSVLSGGEETPAETTAPANTSQPVPVTEATIGPGAEQQIVIGPDGTANSAPAANTAPATNSAAAAPARPNPPSNQ